MDRPDADLYIPEARYIKADGLEQIIQPVGTRLRPGSAYYNRYEHKGHIKCLCCESPMRFHEGSSVAGGSSGVGARSYFAPVKKHDDDCIRSLHKPSPEGQKVDRTKGYRIHINTREFSSEFNKRSGVYEVNQDGYVTAINDPDLKDREIYVVKDVKDVVALMVKGNPRHLKDSKVIFGNESVDWLDFCIPLNREDRYRKLVDRAIAAKSEDELPFALLHIRTTEGRVFRGFEPQAGSNIPATRIPYGRDDRGKKREIEPSADVKNRHNTHVMWGFQDKGDYLVMGVVRHNTFKGDFKTIEYLNVTVDHAGQFQKVDMDNLEKEAKAAVAARRGSGPESAPSGP